jgi:pimeloyl-ACP methyl ester carboxylesterase
MVQPARSGRQFIGIILVFWIVSATPGSAASRRVDVGGFQLNLRCNGEGSPTVVLDAGAGDTLETWDWVVPEVRRFARVCAYDRAGLGRSGAGPLPRTSERIVEELHALLARARVPGPYVLVGHSFGGLNVRLYASRHPGVVAGVVLVDATPEDFPETAAAQRPLEEREKLRTVLGMAPAALRSELDAMPESTVAVRTAAPTDAPVIVLTAALGDDTPSLQTLWAELQRRMTMSFPHGRQVIAQQSGHYIQFDQPELVVAAIRELVVGARTSQPPPAPDP